MAKIKGETSLLIQNMDVRDITRDRYLYDEDSKREYRQMIFDCASSIARKINKNESRTIPVYFMESNSNLQDTEEKPDSKIGTQVVEILGGGIKEIHKNRT